MKILTKYLLVFFVCILFTAGVAGAALWGLKDLLGTTSRLFEREMVIHSLVNKFSLEMSRLRQVEKEFFVFPDNPSRQGKYKIVWNNMYNVIAIDILPGFDEPLRANNDTRKLAMVALASELIEENSLEWQRVTKKFSKTKSFDDVNMAEYGIFKKRMKELEDIAAQMTESSFADLQGQRDTIQATRAKIEMIIKIILTLSVIWGIGAPYLITRKMSGVIGEITIMADQLSYGRVTGDLKIERHDELGDLVSAVIRIQKSMRILLARLKQLAE